MCFLAYFITWYDSFPIFSAKRGVEIGPKPGFENYTAMLKRIPEFSNEVPRYIIAVKVILSKF
jgi:hypothetical protein